MNCKGFLILQLTGVMLILMHLSVKCKLLKHAAWSYQEEVNISVPCKEQDKKYTTKYLHCSFLFKTQMVKLRIGKIDTTEYSTVFFKSSVWENVKVLKRTWMCLWVVLVVWAFLSFHLVLLPGVGASDNHWSHAALPSSS